MVWAYIAVVNACLQLLISVATGFAAAAKLIATNFSRTLQKKARVLKIRALRALDSMGTMGAAPRSAPAEIPPELWGLIAEHSGLVGAWRLTGVCRASRDGAKAWLRTLPGLVVCGGLTLAGEISSGVWRLDLAELRWEQVSDLVIGRFHHACCAVRGSVVVLGGQLSEAGPLQDSMTASVEILGCDSEAGTLPPLSCGPLECAAAIEIEESESEQGQVLLIGGYDGQGLTRAVHKVDLATGVCTPQPRLTVLQTVLTGARLLDGRVVCTGGIQGGFAAVAEVLEPPARGSQTDEAGWQWRVLPAVSRDQGCGGFLLSDGRFAVFGGFLANHGLCTSSCEALTLDDGDERWEPMQPMIEGRANFVCAAVGGCVIVAGGHNVTQVAPLPDEVYDEALGRWKRLPCTFPIDGMTWAGSALM
jgi:hypothetical protein